MTRITLVADDYGISPAVNGAIRDLIARRRINATSVMTASPSFNRDEAQRLSDAAAGTGAAIGLHLTLTAPFAPLSAGYAPARDGRFLPLGRTALAALLGRLDLRALGSEARAQIGAFIAAFGRPPDFVDGHQHVHLLPRIADAMLTAMKELAPQAWVRQCGRARGAPGDRKAAVLDRLSGRFRTKAAVRGVRTNPAFAGTYDFRPKARYADLFPQFLDRMPDGGVIMCHPGVVDAELTRLDPLTTLRASEYAFFKSDAFPAILAARGVTLA